MMKLNCRCGNFEVVWDAKISSLLARKCSCDYCILHDIDYVSDPESPLKFTIRDPSKYKIVQHGTNTANFYECVSCGLVLVTSDIENDVYAVLNAKVLGVNNYQVDKEVKIFTNESVAVKLARRKKNWCKVIAPG